VASSPASATRRLNIVFDLGGVVVRWQPQAIVAAVYADPQARALALREIIGHPDWVEQDRGVLSRDDAITRASRRTGFAPAEVARLFDHVPGALTPVLPVIELIYRLAARQHALFCLSNMHADFIAHLEKTLDIWELFKGKVISCRVHYCKPEPAIYACLLETHGLDPAQTVFIDDVAVNIEAAARCGIRGIHFESPQQCEQELRALGCL